MYIHVVRAEKSKAQKQPACVIVEMRVHLCLRHRVHRQGCGGWFKAVSTSSCWEQHTNTNFCFAFTYRPPTYVYTDLMQVDLL